MYMANPRVWRTRCGPRSGVAGVDSPELSASGGNMDTITVLVAILDAGLEKEPIFTIFGSEAMQAMQQAGIGAAVTLSLGGKVEIVVISNHVKPHDLAAFTAVGITPQRKRFVMLKSRVH